MLGVSNQLLAAFALAIGTSVLINMGRARYVWCTLIPLAFMCVNTLTAGWMNLGINYLRPQLLAGAPNLWAAFLAAPTPARLQCIVTLIVMLLLVVVVVDCLFRWSALLRGRSVEVADEALPRLARP
jgi:carbon starvation protein